jgi:hypothetical protein
LIEHIIKAFFGNCTLRCSQKHHGIDAHSMMQLELEHVAGATHINCHNLGLASGIGATHLGRV